MTSNIVLLTIDALRADHLSCYQYERRTTPFIDSLAEDSVLFENAYSASSHTREAVPSLLTGLYPDEATGDNFTCGRDTVATYLSEICSTGGFHSNPYVSRAYGFDRDFDAFDDDLHLGQHRVFALIQRALDKFMFNRGAYHARAEDINERSLAWLDSLPDDEPFLLWNHYMDVHGPYNPPEEYNEWGKSVTNSEAQELYDKISGDRDVTDDEIASARNLYDGEIAYIDAQIKSIFSELNNRGLLEDSVVIVTADHGDLFGEHGKFAHPRYVYQELTRIPLLLWTPDTEKVRVDAACSIIDILPTILDWVKSESAYLPGRSLFNYESFDPNRIVFSTARGVGNDRNLRRVAANQNKCSYLLEYNLSDGSVRNEQRAGEVSNGTVTDWGTLREEALSFLETFTETKGESDDQKINEEIEQRLDSLGYK